MRQQPELQNSYDLLKRYHLEHFMTPHEFFYPKVALDFYQSMTTRGVWKRFTFDKWNQLAGYSAPPGAPPMVAPPVPPQSEKGKLLAETTPLMPTPEATSAALPITPIVPPIVLTTSESSISASKFHALVHTFQALTTTHSTFFQQMAEMRALITSRLLFSAKFSST
ncbi:hypothetical protein AAG906_003813 [Vitis piasezkii]